MPCKVLIVDDDDVFRRELGHSLSDYDIVEARTGEEALQILARPNEIDVVILDVVMPGENGTVVLRKMKTIAPELGIVILTGHSSEDVAIQSLKGHADDYIEKPCSINKLKQTIEKLLEGRRRRSGDKGDDISDKVAHVRDYLERNCFKRVTLGDASRAVSLSSKYLSRVFKELTGKGFSDYRLGIQMEKAKELLAQSGFNVSEISDKLGYQNPESFIRQFKRFAACTPTEYRRKNRPKNNRSK